MSVKLKAPRPKTNLDYLQELANRDVTTIRDKDKQYGSSWKKRGGVGAFMMLARKWDRLENALDPEKAPQEIGGVAPLSRYIGKTIPAYDIIAAASLDTRSEGILDDIRDLRNYLLLIESEVIARRESGG